LGIRWHSGLILLYVLNTKEHNGLRKYEQRVFTARLGGKRLCYAFK
jgi:hypothetical protein